MSETSPYMNSLSFGLLAVLAVLMAMAPWPAGPEPHLFEKTGMLLNGTLTRPIDIFDLVVHGAPAVLLLAKTLHWLRNRD